MKQLIVIVFILAVWLKGFAQTDPTLAGMIVVYTDKAKKQLKAQEKAMLLQTTGHIWLKEEYDSTIDFQQKFNDYLDSFRSVIVYAAQIYGFYYEIGKLTENISKVTEQMKKSPTNAIAVALTPKRAAIYRELVLQSVDIVNDIRQVCLSDIKMTEKERVEIVFGIRPKIKLMNRKLQHLALAVKYTSLSDVWRDLDLKAKSYEVDKRTIVDAAYRRWRSNGNLTIDDDGGGTGTGNVWIVIGGIRYPWWYADSLIQINPNIIINQ